MTKNYPPIGLDANKPSHAGRRRTCCLCEPMQTSEGPWMHFSRPKDGVITVDET